MNDDPGSNQGDLTWLARILDEKLAPLSARLAALEAKVDGGGFDPGAIGDAVVDRLKDRL